MNTVERGFEQAKTTSRGPALTPPRAIGAILAGTGRLSVTDVERIAQLQKAKRIRFGEAAVALGLVNSEDIRLALANQFNYAYLAPDDDSLSHELIAAYIPFSPAVERLRVLRSQLTLRAPSSTAPDELAATDQEHDRYGPRRPALAIVSPGSGEGRSFIAANLAVVFVQQGQRTLLVDADLRTPRQHQLFRLGNGPGLSDLLAGRCRDAARVMAHIPAIPGLSVLPAGAVPPNPQELLSQTRFADTLNRLCRDYDVVLVDTPPASDYADAEIVAARAGAALVVARKHSTPVGGMARVANSLQLAGTRVVGALLNDPACSKP